jgi:adenosylcobinamide hydrolase
LTDPCDTSIPGIAVTIDERAVRVTSQQPLTVLSSATLGGGLLEATRIVNMHVDDGYDGSRPQDEIAAFAAADDGLGGAGAAEPIVGLMTAAHTEHARLAVAAHNGLTVAAVVSVGLYNTTSAGVSPPMAARAGTINVILLIDAALVPAAMVNAVITATEAKTMVLGEWQVRTPAGDLASGTSTDTVVVACTDRGEPLEYCGPATTVGWLVGQTVRAALDRICREKQARDGGRIGW